MHLRLFAAASCLLITLAANAEPVTGPVKLTTEEYKKAGACQENMAKLDGAKEQWALEYRATMGTTATMQNLLDPSGAGKPDQGYLKRKPVCPAGGVYTVGTVGSDPTCSLGAEKGHSLNAKVTVVDTPTTAPAPAK